jgi:hypothetical protein
MSRALPLLAVKHILIAPQKKHLQNVSETRSPNASFRYRGETG